MGSSRIVVDNELKFGSKGYFNTFVPRLSFLAQNDF